MDEKKVVPVMENMWREKDGEIYLIGDICEDCGEVYFPKKDLKICACCGSEKIVEKELAGKGKVYNMVTINYPPAGGFYHGPVPFTEIIAEMDDHVLVPGHLTGAAPEDVKAGDRVKVVVEPLFEHEGETVISYKFTPDK